MTANLDAPDSRPIPIICGPTASGKTAIAHALAHQYLIEVVSADSRQLVRHLNIGTAKPTEEERGIVPYHLIDVIDPGDRYSAFRYIGDATRVIGEILRRGHRPVVVGGTGLYLRALTDGIVEIQEQDMEVRERLEREMEVLGPAEMYARLQKIDPLEATRIHPHNHVRIIRALEIYYLTGKSKSEVTATGTYRKGQYNFNYFCLMPNRDWLYQRIERRVETMMQQGLLQELVRLIEGGWKERIRIANIIGYNELLDYIDDRATLDEAVSAIKQHTRRYAKRQMTWFRGHAAGRFFSSAEELTKAVQLG